MHPYSGANPADLQPNRSWRPWWPVFVVALLIFVASALPARRLPADLFVFGLDKVGHAAEYAPFGFFVARAWRLRAPAAPTWAALLVALVAAALYGISDEFHHSFVPGRSVDAFDVVADVGGGLLGALGALLIERVQRARRLRSNQKP